MRRKLLPIKPLSALPPIGRVTSKKTNDSNSSTFRLGPFTLTLTEKPVELHLTETPRR